MRSIYSQFAGRGEHGRIEKRSDRRNKESDARRRRERIAPIPYDYAILLGKERFDWIGILKIIGFFACYTAVIVIGMYAMAGWVYQR